MGVGYLAEVAISMVIACLDASQPAVWRVHVRRIADASAHRPHRSMSRRASDLPTTLSQLASIAGWCSFSERRPALHHVLLQPAPAVAASDWRQVAVLTVRVAMPRRSDACAGSVAVVGLVVWLALSVWLHE